MSQYNVFETDHLCAVHVDHERHTDFVRIGTGLAVARRFIAEVTPADESLPICKLRVLVEDRPICVALQCERRPGGAPLTSALLRRLPLAQYVREVTTHESFRYTHDEAERKLWASGRTVLSFELDGRPAWGAPRPPGRSLADDAEERRAAVRLMSRRQPRRGIPITDDDLREVAEVYRAHEVTGRPTAAVMEHHNVARATASRWIARARERGYLGAAFRGRGGERP